jgi:hypothetical protein
MGKGQREIAQAGGKFHRTCGLAPNQPVACFKTRRAEIEVPITDGMWCSYVNDVHNGTWDKVGLSA